MNGNIGRFEKICGEKCAERIIRRALYEAGLDAETPGDVYNAACAAAHAEINPGFGDIRNIEQMRARKENRWYELLRSNHPAAKPMLHRLDMEMGVLDWAAEELRAIVRSRRAKREKN